MEEKKNHSRKRAAAILIAVIAVVVAALLIHQFLLKNDESDTGSGAGEVVAWDVDIDTEEDTAGATGAIQIPGYESMIFTAGETIQTVDIGNPADNTCYFVITLLLEDGTELFQSDYLEPGQGFESIELTQALEEGEYTAVIRYECYSMEDMSALNGASSEFTLIVK
ncbi:MAG: hypothetical protein LUG27_03835 [Clostridiales bacterium]|nr:hypothetical protein [Clostridiales bacterium]